MMFLYCSQSKPPRMPHIAISQHDVYACIPHLMKSQPKRFYALPRGVWIHLNTPPLTLSFSLCIKTISFVHAKHILLVMPAIRDNSACSLWQPGLSHLTKPPSTFYAHLASCLSSSQQDRHWMPSIICVSVSGVLEYPKT